MRTSLIVCSLFGFIASAQDLTQADLMLGNSRHQKIAGSSQFISQGEAYEKLKRVFDHMANTGTLHVNVAVPQQLFFVDDQEINAFAAGGGRVYVMNGLMQAIRGDEGSLAFVLGHEMAHNLRQHGVRKYFRAVEHDRMTYFYATRCRAGDNSSCWANIGYQTASAIAEKKIERDEENEADFIGMMAAAEAGYHPDYAIVVARRLRDVGGEQSKFAAFFSGHPRWTTREERAERNYGAALSVFERSWPSVGSSPGGLAPAIAAISDIKVQRLRRVKSCKRIFGSEISDNQQR
jgi:predicted Zn-dependent protease